MKRGKKCGETKPLDQHHAATSTRDALRRARGMLRGAGRAALRRTRKTTATGRRAREGSSLHVDHDHDTDDVRGLLCFSCNAAIGTMADDVERLVRAADDIDRAGSRSRMPTHSTASRVTAR